MNKKEMNKIEISGDLLPAIKTLIAINQNKTIIIFAPLHEDIELIIDELLFFCNRNQINRITVSLSQGLIKINNNEIKIFTESKIKIGKYRGILPDYLFIYKPLDFIMNLDDTILELQSKISTKNGFIITH